MTVGPWPFPGDSGIAKARRMALAYRELAKEQHDRAMDLLDVLGEITEAEWRMIDPGDPGAAADMYKLLHQERGDPVADLDRRFTEWGELWHTDIEIDDLTPEDEVDAKTAGKLIQVSGRSINLMRVRGRIDGKFIPEKPNSRRGKWVYKVADVYKLSTEVRRRGWNLHKGTVTVDDSGRGDSE